MNNQPCYPLVNLPPGKKEKGKKFYMLLGGIFSLKHA